MLCITLLPNDYFTIGENVVVQFGRLDGERVHLTIKAPREIPIVRGQVLERQGGRRPDCVMEKSPRHVRQLSWNHQKKQALAELRELVERMGDSPEAEAIAGKLNLIFPQNDSAN